MSHNVDAERGEGKTGLTGRDGAYGAGNGVGRGSNIANPGALGLLAFGSTLFLLSMYNVHTRHITHPNVVIGMALFTGGLAQLLAGMWEFPKGNTFGAAMFTLYGGFWLSLSVLLIPASGATSTYSLTSELQSAVGIYLMTWFLISALFLIGSLRKSISLIAFFSFLSLTFLLLGISQFKGNSSSLLKAGGGLGIVTSLIALYMGLSELLASERSRFFALPQGPFGQQY